MFTYVFNLRGVIGLVLCVTGYFLLGLLGAAIALIAFVIGDIVRVVREERAEERAALREAFDISERERAYVEDVLRQRRERS